MPSVILRHLCLAAEPKVGKTQLMLGMVRALLLRESSLGQSAKTDFALHLSEHLHTTLQDQMTRAGMNRETHDGCRVSPWQHRADGGELQSDTHLLSAVSVSTFGHPAIDWTSASQRRSLRIA